MKKSMHNQGNSSDGEDAALRDGEDATLRDECAIEVSEWRT